MALGDELDMGSGVKRIDQGGRIRSMPYLIVTSVEVANTEDDKRVVLIFTQEKGEGAQMRSISMGMEMEPDQMDSLCRDLMIVGNKLRALRS